MDAISCTPKSLPAWSRVSAARTAIRLNPNNRARVERLTLLVPDFEPTPDHLAVLVTKYWGAKGVRLTVSFLDNPPADLAARILLHANAWGAYANVVFTPVQTGGQVRIARDGSGYWSYLGTDILHVDPAEATLNLQEFTMQTPESEFHRVVRHEIGHTLGFPHEHLRRELVSRLDPAKTIAYFGRTQGWSPQVVRQQVLTPLEESSLLGTEHADQTSIMTYQLPANITLDGQPIPGGLDIDADDQTLAGKLYPRAVSPPAPPLPPGPGSATLTLPATLPAGTYTLTKST